VFGALQVAIIDKNKLTTTILKNIITTVGLVSNTHKNKTL